MARAVTARDAEVALGWFLTAWDEGDGSLGTDELSALDALLAVAEDPKLRDEVGAILPRDRGRRGSRRRSTRAQATAGPTTRSGWAAASRAIGIVVGWLMFLFGLLVLAVNFQGFLRCLGPSSGVPGCAQGVEGMALLAAVAAAGLVIALVFGR